MYGEQTPISMLVNHTPIAASPLLVVHWCVVRLHSRLDNGFDEFMVGLFKGVNCVLMFDELGI
jgi:hypothetical protein